MGCTISLDFARVWVLVKGTEGIRAGRMTVVLELQIYGFKLSRVLHDLTGGSGMILGLGLRSDASFANCIDEARVRVSGLDE